MAKAKKIVETKQEEIKHPVVRNVQNNYFYLYLGENKFKNLVSGQEGVVESEKAKELFVINIEATIIFNEYPMAKELIQVLALKFDNNKNQSK